MTDPIQGVGPSGPLDIASPTQPGSRTPPAEPATPAAGVDSANVAQTETLLATIAKASDGIAVVDEARVAALKQAIEAGSFETNPQQIAQKMVELEALLAGRTGGQ